jgi:hypothetical protein
VLCALAVSAPIARARGAAHPVILELFTSQGCSSCPPADALLSQLADRPGVLALSYHVTYWNSLGWTDPYSSEAATERQSAYSTALSNSQVYTPQLIVQGSIDAVGSNRSAVAKAMDAAAADGTWIPVTLERTDGRVRIKASAQGGLDADITLVGYLKYAENQVPRGENSGTTLRHRNSVTSIKSLGRWNGTTLDLTEELPPGDGVAVILQAPGQGAIVGGGWAGN